MQIADLFYSVRGEGFDKLESSLDKTSQKLSGIGKAFSLGVTAPVMAMGAGIIKTTMTFDTEMSKVAGITGATGKEFNTMRELAQEMGSKTSKSATESAQAIQYMGLAGWDLGQIQQGLEPILRASEAGFMDLGLTSDLVTDSMSALGIGTEDLGGYLDIAAKAQNTSNQSMEQFLTAMVTAGGTFKMFNVPLEESGALLGILANRGFKGSEAGNALTSIFANLTTGSGQAGKAMGELGIKVYDAEGKFRGTTTILKELNSKFDGMTEAQRNTYIQMLGGKTRTKELNALLNGTAEELDDLSAKLYDSDGALSQMALTMQDNLSGQVTRIKSLLEGLAISVGDLLTPYLEKMAVAIEKVVNFFFLLPDKIKIGIVVFGLLAASIGPLLLVLASLVGAVGFVVSAIGTIGLPAVAVIAVIGVLGGAFLGIIGVITAVMAKTGALQIVFDKIKFIIMAVVSVLRGDLNSAFLILTDNLGLNMAQARMWTMKLLDAKKAVGQLITLVKNITTLLGAMFTGDKQAMIDTLRKKFGLTKDEAKKFADKALELKDKIVELAKQAKLLALGAIALLADKIKAAAKFVYDNRKEIALFIGKLVELSIKAINTAKTLWDKFNQIKNSIKSAMDTGKQAIDKIVKTFNTMESAVGAVVAILKKIAFPKPPAWLSGKIPGFADGVRNFSGGWAMVGERGAELVNLPKGSNVFSNQESKGMLKPSGSTTNNLSTTGGNTFNVNMKVEANSIKEVNDLLALFNNLEASYISQ